MTLPPALHRRLPDAGAVLLLLLLALAFFWPVTLGLGWIPRGGGDLVSFLWPTYSYAAQALQDGRLPLWNHSLYAGAPLAADNQSGLFYPPNVLMFLAWPGLPYRALEWLVVLHVWLAGAGMYGLLRLLLPGARAAAFMAAVAYMFSDVFVTHIGNLNIVAVAAWLPLAFAALHLGLSRSSAGWCAAAGAALALAALAGHAQMTLIVAAGLGLYGAWHAVRARAGALRGRAAWSAAARSAALTALAFAVALGLSAVSLLPAVEMTAYTARARLDYAAAAEYSLPWAGLAGLFSPLVFGRGAQHFWADWPRVEAGYAGALTLLLAALTLLKPRRGWAIFLLLLAGFGLLVALGSNAPLHRLLYATVPGFAQLRVPARFILLTSFALAALGGLGLARAAALSRRQLLAAGAATWLTGCAVMLAAHAGEASAAGAAEHRAGLALGLAVFSAMLLAGLLVLLSRRPAAAGLLIAALLAADMLGHGAWVEVEQNDPTAGFQHPIAAAYLQAQPGPTRIDNTAGAWSPDAAALLGLEDIGGISNPLALAAYHTYLGSVGSRGAPLYNFLNVQYVLAAKGEAPAQAGSPLVAVFDEDPGLDIYLNTAALPRAQLIYDAVPAASGEAAFGALHAPDFDPSRQVIIQAEAGQPVALRGGQPPAGESNLFYLNYAPESFSIVALTPGPAYLVMSEVWYPGWRALVNGAEVPVLQANFAFRAVYLESAGEHTLTMRFDPLSFRLGALISALTVAALLGWGGWAAWRRRRPAQPARVA